MKSKLDWLELSLLLLPFLLLAFFWNTLPARVPVHWNLHNEVDAWSSKGAGLLPLPFIGLGVIVLLRVLPRLDPKLRKQTSFEGRMPAVLPLLRVVFAAFFAVIFCIQLAAALGRDVPVGPIVTSSTLILFAVLGNYLGNLRPNYFIGIRTPWTLESPATWRATHRLGGKLMFYGALLLLLLQFFLSDLIIVVLVAGSVVSLAIWAMFYSWYYSRRETAPE